MIVIRTEVMKSGVLYEVLRDGAVEWVRFVLFGRDRAHRAGGQAFQEASRAQTTKAVDLQMEGVPCL